jgi:hypothetical protein
MRFGDISVMNIKTVVFWDVMQCVNTNVLEETFTFSIDGRNSSKHWYLSTIQVLLQQRTGSPASQ